MFQLAGQKKKRGGGNKKAMTEVDFDMLQAKKE